ncbi:trichohyalin-like [Pygocentrus nattereri]|uniref:trichohyalin-like n=1 Tax=Pygocentrus nattereri TaxID=42514 RepID=UPI0018912D53|nr:trichohyalin-like [Pygocentrus nattereri]
MLRPLCSSPPCGCWGGCLPKIPFFCFENKILERQIEEACLRQLQRESRETERELEEMKREVRRLKKNQCKLEEKGRRQQEKERKKEERERAQRKKSMERMRLSQMERSELETLRELELRQLSELRALERESRSSDREHHTPARKMDALQQPWTGAGQQGLLPLHSQNVVDLHIEDIHLMMISDAQKPSKLVVLEETMRRNAAKILQLREEEEKLKRELEELKLRMASMIKSREEERLPELGLQRGMKRQIRMEKKLHAMEREKKELKREQEEQWKQAEERLREMEERESIERREEKWREMLKKAEEEWGQIDEVLLQEPVQQRDEVLLQEPVQQIDEVLLQEPLNMKDEQVLQKPVRHSKEDLLQEPVQQREDDLLQEPVQQKEEDLQQPGKQGKEDLKDIREQELKIQKARQEYMARQQQRKREQLRRRYAPGQNWFISEDSAQRRRTGGRQMTNKTSSEEKKEENTDLENKQNHLQNLSWPVSPNGDGLLINVKPLYPCAEPEEVLGAFTPSTADSTKDPTPENNVEEQEINDPEEPSPQPQAFSEPQEDTQIFTDSSKLLTKEEDEAEVGASSRADDIKESVLQTPQNGSMVQCCVQRDRTDKSCPTYRMFQELEGGKKQLLLVARRMKKDNTSSYVITDGESDEDHNVVGRLRFNRQRTQFTLSDSGRNPTKSSGALQEESSTQELLALSYESLFGFMKSQQMTAVIPSPDRNSQRVSFVEGSLLKQIKRKNQGPNLIKLNTKEPVWSSKQKAHVLDFNGRVKKASLKNFQLACPANLIISISVLVVSLSLVLGV